MKPRSALLAAIACGALALLLVALDLAFNVEARLEAQQADGSWATVATTAYHDPRDSTIVQASGRCAQQFRLIVHNGMPWASRVRLQINGFGAGIVLPPQTWTLAAGGEQSFSFAQPNVTATLANGTQGQRAESFVVQFPGSDIGSLYSPGCLEAAFVPAKVMP